MQIKRGQVYRVGDTGYTLELTYKGYVVRCGDKDVVTRMSRKSILAWLGKNKDRCPRK